MGRRPVGGLVPGGLSRPRLVPAESRVPPPCPRRLARGQLGRGSGPAAPPPASPPESGSHGLALGRPLPGATEKDELWFVSLLLPLPRERGLSRPNLSQKPPSSVFRDELLPVTRAA